VLAVPGRVVQVVSSSSSNISSLICVAVAAAARSMLQVDFFEWGMQAAFFTMAAWWAYSCVAYEVYSSIAIEI
jgi:hypothetical protein